MELYSSQIVLQVFRLGSDTSTSNRRPFISTFREIGNSQIFNTKNTPIPFEVERLNVGGAIMNLTSGKFTAPRDGIDSFSFNGLAWFPASSSTVYLYLFMYLNGSNFAKGYADAVGTHAQYETFSWQSTLNVKAGDQIWIEIDRMSTGV